QTVAPGSSVTFSAVAVRVCGHGHEDCPQPDHYPEGTPPGLSYQWFFYGSPIPGATSNSFTIPNVQPDLLGTYTLRVSTLWQSNESQDAFLQINFFGSSVEQILAVDKFQDAENPLLLGTVGGAGPTGNDVHALAASVVRGYTGTQIFNTVGSATSPGEVVCGVI